MLLINWCNENQGFLAAVFSVLSLLISSIAIVISITTARLPYKKALKISCGSYYGLDAMMEDDTGVYVNILNVGNVPINIIEVGLLYKKEHYINVNTIPNAIGILRQMESVEQSFLSARLKERFRGKKGRVYAFAKDAEGRVYKRYLCKATDL